MTDNANYGHLITDCPNIDNVVCGLICVDTSVTGTGVNIENCVNKGSVEGAKAYGISNTISGANNVVSMGVVNGKDEESSYSFWGKTGIGTSIYGLTDVCVLNCDGNTVNLFEMNESDKKYHTVTDNNAIVDSLLNEEADRKGYYLRWDRNLMLRKPIIIHIHIGSPVNLYEEAYIEMTLEECGIPDDVLQYHLFINGTNASSTNEFNKTTMIYSDIDLVPYYLITIEGIDILRYIEASEENTLEGCGIRSDVFKCHLFKKGSDPSTSNEINKTKIIEGDLVLVPYYMVTVSGEIINGTYYVNAGNQSSAIIGSIPDLVEYFKSQDYVVGDSNTNALVHYYTILTGDMNITVMSRSAVASIDMDERLSASEVNESEIALAISDLTGVDASEILIELVVNDKGYVIRVIVILPDTESRDQLTDIVDDCQNAQAADYESSSLSSRIYLHHTSVLLFLFMFLFTTTLTS